MLIKNPISSILIATMFLGCAPIVKNASTNKSEGVPDGIRYKTSDSTTNAVALRKLHSALEGDGTNAKWFNKGVGCLPFFWKDLSSNPYFSNADGAELTVMVPLSGGVQTFKGKSFRQQSELDSLQSLLIEIIKNDGPFVIRKPNPQELQLYWAFITFDIEEPIFTIETKSHKFLIDFYNDYILQFDDYYGVSFGK